MSACPNTNSPEWKALVESFIKNGSKPDVAEATAHAVFKLNDENIPTFDEAKKILDGVKPMERDEQVARYSDKLKLERAKDQLQTLTSMRDRISNPAQKETLGKVIQMVNSYMQFLTRNIALAEAGQPTVKTISVSNFIGSADFKGDPMTYDAFKQFGIFMHEVLEKAQVQAVEYGVPITTILTREFFEQMHEEFTAKAPFEIPELTLDTMYAQAINMAMHIKTKSDARFLILPEVTIAGANKQGSLIIGRLDLMMIDPEGKVHVFDFKTKKVKNCVREDDDTGEEYMVEDRVMVHLAKQNFPIDRKEGTAVEFMAKQRSTFDTWMLQTKVYENILGQHNIETGNSTILGLMYQVDPGSGRFQDAMFGVFDIPNFYTYARYTVVPGDNGLWKTDPDAQARELMKLKDIVNQEIPVSKEQEKKMKEKEVKLLDFTPTSENNTLLFERLRESVESELDEVVKQIADLDKNGERNSARRELLYARKKTLMDFEQVLLRTDDTSKGHSVNFSLVMDYVEADLKMMEKLSDDSIAAYRNTTNQRERMKHVTQIMTAFRKTRGLYDIISALREIVDEARGTEKNLQNSEVVKKLENLNTFNDRIESNFREVGLAMGVMILRTPGKKVFEGVKKDIEEGAIPKLEKLKAEYEALKQGKASSIFRQLKNSMLSFVSQRMKEGIAKRSGNAEVEMMDDIMAMERQIKKLEAYIMHGLDYTEESIATYISGVTDPKSDIYIGATDVFNNSTLLSGLGQMIINPGNLMASVSDSELAVSAFTQMYKNAQAQAQYNLQNNLVLLNFDKLRDGLLKRMSLEQLNDMISEWRTVKVMDRKSGKMEDRRTLYMVKPFSEEYEKTYRDFQTQLRDVKREISEANKAYNQAFAEYRKAVKELKTSPATDAVMSKIKEKEKLKDEAEKALLDKKRERDVLTDKQMDWMMANCSLPFSDAFYRYQRMLPQDIRDQLQKKYLEKQVITHQEGAGNEIMLDENDFDRLKELDTEIRKLREEAKKRDPKYAQYIDEFNNLYEYDININFFERMRDNAKTRFADHPELWQKWLKNNTIDTPTKRQAIEPIQQGSYVTHNGLVYTIEEVMGDTVTLMDFDTGALRNAPISELDGLNWYDELNTLYKIRADIYGRNPEIEALMERKREIMRPHKDAGRFDPQFLTEEETDELDGINASMEQIFEDSEMPELTEEEREITNTIRERIKNISQKRINPNYTDLFNRKMQTLESAYKNMIQAESQLASAVGKGDSKTISKVTKDLAFFRSQFDVVELEFEKWYNMNHDNEYKSIRDGYDVRGNVSPKAFNFELVPSPGVADKYMEYGKPHPKYKIKRLKESAKNPNFLQSADGIPMPQGIVKDAEGYYQIQPGYEASTNVNAKYRKIMADPEIFNFYNKMMDAFFAQQKKIQGRRVGYMVPGYAMNKIESLARDGVFKSMERQWDLFIDKQIKAKGEQDYVENTFGDMGGLRMRYTEQLPEELQSQDAVGALLKYSLEAEYNIAMQEVTPMADAFIEYLELLSEDLKKTIQSGKTITIDPVTKQKKMVDMSRRQRELDDIIDQMKFERRKFAYGQEESDNQASRAIKKRMNMIFQYTSMIRMGFDVANQTKNFISGNVQAWIAAGNHTSDHYSRMDMLWAKSKIYGYDGFLHNWFADWGKVSDISDSTMLYRLYNPAQKNFSQYLDEVSGGRGRRAKATMLGVQEMGYMIQDKGDTEVALTVMYSVLNHYKFAKIKSYDNKGEPILETDDNGETVMIPAHECYTRGANGMMERRSDVLFDLEDENRLRNIIYSEMRRAQGNYASSDMTKFEETVVGKLVFFYRKYLVPQLLNRFGYLRPNWEAGEAALGYWRAVAMSWKYYGASNTLKHFILGTKLAKKFGSTVDLINVTDKSGRTVQRQGDLYTRKMAQARRDAFVMAMMTVLGMLVMSYIRRKDEDDEEIGMLEGNALRVFWGTKGEVMSMFPLGGGSDEYIRNFTSLTVYTRELNAIKRLGSHTWNLAFAMMYNGGEEPDPDIDGDTAYQTWKDAFYTRKAGRFEEGDAKIVKDIEDLTGIRNFKDFFDPTDRVQQMKRNQ